MFYYKEQSDNLQAIWNYKKNDKEYNNVSFSLQVETLSLETAPGAGVSTARITLMMRTSSWITTELAGSPWPTQV